MKQWFQFPQKCSLQLIHCSMSLHHLTGLLPAYLACRSRSQRKTKIEPDKKRTALGGINPWFCPLLLSKIHFFSCFSGKPGAQNIVNYYSFSLFLSFFTPKWPRLSSTTEDGKSVSHHLKPLAPGLNSHRSQKHLELLLVLLVLKPIGFGILTIIFYCMVLCATEQLSITASQLPAQLVKTS